MDKKRINKKFWMVLGSPFILGAVVFFFSNGMDKLLFWFILAGFGCFSLWSLICLVEWLRGKIIDFNEKKFQKRIADEKEKQDRITEKEEIKSLREKADDFENRIVLLEKQSKQHGKNFLALDEKKFKISYMDTGLKLEA